MNCKYCNSSAVEDMSSTQLHSSAGLQQMHNLFKQYRCKTCGRSWQVSKLRLRPLVVVTLIALLGGLVLIVLHQLGLLPDIR